MYKRGVIKGGRAQNHAAANAASIRAANWDLGVAN
jgi:hypothetical protein